MRILVLRWGPQWSWSSPGREVEHLFFVQESQFLHKADRLTLVEPSFLSDGCGHLIDGPAILGHSGPPSHIWSFLPLSCGPALGGEQIVIKENFLEGVQPLYFSSIIRLQNICCWVVIFFFFFYHLSGRNTHMKFVTKSMGKDMVQNVLIVSEWPQRTISGNSCLILIPRTFVLLLSNWLGHCEFYSCIFLQFALAVTKLTVKLSQLGGSEG